MVQGQELILDILNQFCKNNDFDVEVKMDTDFWADVNRNIVYFSVLEMPESRDEFMESLRRWHPIVTMDCCVWSFLHEVFHIETIDDFDEEDWKYNENQKELIENGQLSKLEYYNLPLEVAATRGAVEWVNTHLEETAWLARKLYSAIKAFLMANEVS